ncbi:hypothetical protein [Ammoniphilus resinae]|uniref:Uncharacterized protein n=1 Tax=Ammoniphilus resinae TaxID=861532 RepID=A0ABS4GXR0_9BACL|nr:hypothetical protein [Ammoniphilus resinae]MBP1935056.1 hypothetical protein [Ammoniphilus resinae]
MSKWREHKQSKQQDPTIAPGLEMDELDKSASSEEVEKGDFTEVTKLVIDRVPE